MINLLKEMTIEVTQQCPNKCLFCSSFSHRTAKIFIDFDDIVNLGRQSVDLGLERISISGGEPLFHPDINKIIEYLSQIGLKVALYTTGLAPDKIHGSKAYRDWHNFEKENVSLIFNIQSTDPEVHDRLTRHKGSLNKTSTSLKYALKTGLNVETHIIPNKLNIGQIESTVEDLSVLGVNQISFLRLVVQGYAKDNRDLLVLNEKETLLLKNIFEVLRKNNTSASLRFGIPFSGILDEPKNCNAGENKLIVRYDGKVLPCEAFKDQGFNDYILGDIKTESLSDILMNGSSHTSLRRLKDNTTIYETCPAQLLRT